MKARYNSHKPVFIVAFNGRVQDGCDYATQTIRLLVRTGHVYGLCLGEPISWRTILSCRALPIIQKSFGTVIFRPVFFIPGQRNYFIRRINYLANAFALRIYISFIHPYTKKFLWFFEPFNMPDLLKMFKGYTTIYDCVDYFYDFSNTARKDEQYILACVGHVFANSKTLQTHLKKFRNDVCFVPLGFSLDLFRQYEPTKIVRIVRKQFIVGYVGNIDARIDTRLLTIVVRACPEMQFQFYGNIKPMIRLSNGKLHKPFQRLFALPNATYNGEVPKSIIPAVIDTFDVGMIPYRMDSGLNRHCFPMKTLEYFFYGKPVISTPIEELKRFPNLVRIGKTTLEWERNIRELLSKPWPDSYKRAQRRLATENSWERKIMAISKTIADNNKAE